MLLPEKLNDSRISRGNHEGERPKGHPMVTSEIGCDSQSEGKTEKARNPLQGRWCLLQKGDDNEYELRDSEISEG